MAKWTNEELEFLLNYSNFYSKKDKSLAGFQKACEPLVSSGQISKESVEEFVRRNELGLQLNDKRNKVEILTAEIRELEKQINFEVTKPAVKKVEVDPCSRIPVSNSSMRISSC